MTPNKCSHPATDTHDEASMEVQLSGIFFFAFCIMRTLSPEDVLYSIFTETLTHVSGNVIGLPSNEDLNLILICIRRQKVLQKVGGGIV